MTIDLGKIAITLGGNWASDVSYEALTFVLHSTDDGGDGCGYIAKAATIGEIPASHPTKWMKVAEPGASLYQLAVAHGYTGTEAQFVQEYNNAVQAAIDAASAAAAAAQDAEDGETSRNNAEQARVNAEQARVEAEQLRVLAEQARVQAENNRVTAESTRAANVAAAVAAANAAKTLCDTATGTANAAAQTANTAAGNADAAKDRANAAAAATAALNLGLAGLVVEDGELILVQNSEAGTCTGSSMSDDGEITLEFEV